MAKQKKLTSHFPRIITEKKMAGKDVIFTVTIKGLKEQKLPEIDENFIKNFDKYNILRRFKERCAQIYGRTMQTPE